MEDSEIDNLLYEAVQNLAAMKKLDKDSFEFKAFHLRAFGKMNKVLKTMQEML